ncbi:DUF805 domain-containing protein [Sphingobacterium psychroaquaticum]|uniref:Uncharacterized membrane protein YhaH, DUF805 family n=1 Tax=Sphingobacterium psychroaquaticum TaxID=561061 RepID=A0A1X7L0S2_9SPHI|nr:DUF805 domain-containing protein [Sphingobacterium psychroaquaticum]QBQ39796.1 DUF805 domain-containing protein [Sphingobacterium psychroaquaticum]SMG47421.1 Uncharacterized membrane protein YhaH, DUF805 family [Sphingobacterium psychroaquaticum]
MEWFLKVVRDNYTNFNGRARRKEYWMFVLFNIIISGALSLVDRIFGLTYGDTSPYQSGVLSSIYALAVLLPSIAVAVRRLHDTNKSGWFLLVAFIPFVGWIYLIYLFIKEGDRGQNQYGPDPKGNESNPFGNFPPIPGSR